MRSASFRDFLRKHRPRDHQHTSTQCTTEENSLNYMNNHKVIMYQNVNEPDGAIIKNLTLRDLVQFATEIARGMEFLSNKRIIVRSFVLLVSLPVALASRFGGSKHTRVGELHHENLSG